MGDTVTEEELRKAFMEVQGQMASIIQQQVGVEGQIENKKRELRRYELTLKEIDSLPADTPCYVSVGRMFLNQDQDRVKTDLNSSISASKESCAALEKSKEYLERTLKEKEANIQELLMNKARLQA